MSSAMYWQEPDDEDRRLADPDAIATLRPVAEAVCDSSVTDWWALPIAVDDQHEVALLDSSSGSPAARGENAEAQLAAWRQQTIADDERAAGWPADPAIPITGTWWSTLAHTSLMRTTGRWPGYGPVGLYLVEDSLGWDWAQCTRVRPSAKAVIYEVHRPADWAALVQRYPLPVDQARRHDWRRVTGEDLAWAVPDYPAVAEDFDAIHLSIAGYLSTAGRLLPAGDAYTLLAGWNPDQTWWLTDPPPQRGPSVRWGKGLGEDLVAWAPS